MPNGWRMIKSLVHKIRLHGRRGKGMAESFSREKLRHAPQKEGGWEILCVTFLLCDPDWYVQRTWCPEWMGRKHTHNTLGISVFMFDSLKQSNAWAFCCGRHEMSGNETSKSYQEQKIVIWRWRRACCRATFLRRTTYSSRLFLMLSRPESICTSSLHFRKVIVWCPLPWSRPIHCGPDKIETPEKLYSGFREWRLLSSLVVEHVCVCWLRCHQHLY